MPYVKGVTEPLTRLILKKHNILVSNKLIKTLQISFLRRQTDPKPRNIFFRRINIKILYEMLIVVMRVKT